MGLKYVVKKHAKKGYNGANVLKWNLEYELVVVQWIVQNEINMHATLRCCWKGKVLLLTCIKASKRKGHGSTMNLAIMIETTNA